ncbi:MAG: SIR2 family NAD-dependent protein deacylase [Myxococcaceae bacterium]
MEPEQQLAEALTRTEGLVLVLTGAGISLASGIPTFRGSDPGAVWKRDVTELGTVRYFNEDPAGSWSWYLSRFDKVQGAKPNPAHHALVSLERWQSGRGRGFLLITQNIDTLHRVAGSRELIEVHGRADRVRCSSESCRLGAPRGSIPRDEVDLSKFRANPVRENVPTCPECGAFLRQHVLWFDELYGGHDDYQWMKVQRLVPRAALVLFIGTSLAVGVTDFVMSTALQRSVPVYCVDPGGQAQQGVCLIRQPAEVVLPAVSLRLGAPSTGSA